MRVKHTTNGRISSPRPTQADPVAIASQQVDDLIIQLKVARGARNLLILQGRNQALWQRIVALATDLTDQAQGRPNDDVRVLPDVVEVPAPAPYGWDHV